MTTPLIEIKEIAKDFTILYIEDDKDFATQMKIYLEKFFKNVTCAFDGEEGLDLYTKHQFDIVISDLSLPKMGGLTMIKKIKEINKEQSILIASVHGESEFMFDSIKLGVDGYIIKPFDVEQLNQELYKVVTKLYQIKENMDYKYHLEKMVTQKTSELNRFISYQEKNYEKTLLSIVEMIENRDSYTAGHSKRVAHYCQKIAQEMGYDDEECTKLYRAGILHDVGKIATPDSILLNPKKLNKVEYALIQEHVSVSFQLLSHIPMFEDLANVVYEHHERYDGRGYPQGLSGNKINPLSQIMIIADAFDAMTTNRIYKARKSIDEAIIELRACSGTQFHSKVVEKAISALKNIEINDGINQFPTSKLEEERFAYFYSDLMCNVFNRNYLDMCLMENKNSHEYHYMYVFFLKNLSFYNKKFGWDEGNNILIDIANKLVEYFKDAMIFRVFGDDFAIMAKKSIQLDNIHAFFKQYFANIELDYELKSANIHNDNIVKLMQMDEI